MKRGTPDHPKTIMLTIALEKIYTAHRKKSSFGGRAEAVGILETLWHWCSQYAIQGDIGKWPDDVIAQGIGWTFSGNELISALIDARWIDRAPHPFRLVIHDVRDHATNIWRQNLQDAGLTWWDGSSPRKYKLQKLEDKLQKNSRTSPQPEPEPEPEPIEETPIVPFLLERTSPDQSNGKRKRKPASDLTMTVEQRGWFQQYLAIHPKNTIQLRSATALWATKVTDVAVFDFLMACLNREIKGDVTYLKGPGKWLEDHLELYANGAVPVVQAVVVRKEM